MILHNIDKFIIILALINYILILYYNYILNFNLIHFLITFLNKIRGGVHILVHIFINFTFKIFKLCNNTNVFFMKLFYFLFLIICFNVHK